MFGHAGLTLFYTLKNIIPFLIFFALLNYAFALMLSTLYGFDH